MAEPLLEEIVAATFEKVLPELQDNASNNVPLFRHFKEAGNVQTYDGGTDIRHLLLYQTNGTYTRFEGWQEVYIAAIKTLNAAKFDPKSVMVSFSISGEEELDNSGEAQLIDLVTTKMEGMDAEFTNNMDTDLWSDGTANGGLQIGGMQSLIADSPSSGIVGQINAATWDFWRNYSYDATTDGGAAATSSNIQTYMTHVATRRVRNGDVFSRIFADQNYWELYHQSLLAIQRTSYEKKYGSGSLELEFMGRPVVHCGGYNGGCPANHMYFVVDKTVKLRPHARRNYTQVGKERRSINQDGMVKLVGWRGNLTIGNRLLNSVLKD